MGVLLTGVAKWWPTSVSSASAASASDAGLPNARDVMLSAMSFAPCSKPQSFTREISEKKRHRICSSGVKTEDRWIMFEKSSG